MKNCLELLRRQFDRNAYEREVEEELQFHIEMRAQEYERQGLTPEESFARAALRFGDFAQVRKQCIRIGKHESIATSALKLLFIIAFILGVLVRVLNSGGNVTQVGNVLMMIGVFGGLLVYGKTGGATVFRHEEHSIRLGLDTAADSIPPGVDENGRTPFERLRSDDK